MSVFASSDSTEQDKQHSLELQKDGTKPVKVDRQPYWPKLTSEYEEPKYFPDDYGLDILFCESGKHYWKNPNLCHLVQILLNMDPKNRTNSINIYMGRLSQRVPIRNYRSYQEILGCF